MGATGLVSSGPVQKWERKFKYLAAEVGLRSVSALGLHCGLSKTALNKIVAKERSGEEVDVALDTVNKLARGTGKSVQWILFEDVVAPDDIDTGETEQAEPAGNGASPVDLNIARSVVDALCELDGVARDEAEPLVGRVFLFANHEWGETALDLYCYVRRSLERSKVATKQPPKETKKGRKR